MTAERLLSGDAQLSRESRCSDQSSGRASTSTD